MTLGIYRTAQPSDIPSRRWPFCLLGSMILHVKVTRISKMTVSPEPKKSTVSPVRLQFTAFRRCLTRNEIFFKTIAATTLTVASIAIGIQQMHIAKRQSETAEKQNALSDKQVAFVDLQSRIAEAQAMPSFDIKILQVLNLASG
jgi:cell division protein FtsL